MAASYREDLWAQPDDTKLVPVHTSVVLLHAIHERLYALLTNLSVQDFSRKFRTQVLGQITVDTALQRWIWHNRHHMAQISSILK
ncbi:DinB family protein [Paenibacillus sp. J22TS3]|uniref:DinB family protein n=1 Tax=Paenibacillus sp. J22TS3 TaxID=2807192 RepID=UPI001B2DF123|nr:DinB family protein [Paenibacillus sp. J22TS3]GIP24667.1 hypothetical protein J22TS3_49420 [Paenibacillus sp. J22TS3]